MKTNVSESRLLQRTPHDKYYEIQKKRVIIFNYPEELKQKSELN